MNVVRELSLAANVPMPKVYLIDDTRAQCLRHRAATPSMPAWPSPPGCSRSSTARSSRGSSATSWRTCANYDIRFSLLVGVLVGSIALLADMLARMAFWGGMTGRGAGADGPATAAARPSSSSSSG